jgi:hypothetical protein
MDRHPDDHAPAALPDVPPGLDHARLDQLQQHLGLTRAEIVATLTTELARAMAGIDSALADGDLASAGLAAHTARNSALMIDAQPLLQRLGAVEASARSGNLQAACLARDAAGRAWSALRDELPAA